MKKTIRTIIPIILAAAIIACTGWYLFIYDVAFTQDMLLQSARFFEENGNRKVSAWFYNCAYRQAGNSDEIAIELAERYKESGNYTKAEATLAKAIADGGGKDLYIALCKTYVEQDKLMDAVNMLNNITNKEVKAQIDKLRPAVPTCFPDPSSAGSHYTQYITVTVSAKKGHLYVSTDGEFPSVEEDAYTEGITLKDGNNIITAIAIADNGLVSPKATFGFTVGGVIEKVTFEDTAMEAAIRQLLGVNAEKVIYTNDLWTIKAFDVPEGAENLKDLRHMAFLEKLTIADGPTNQLSNISGLANLTELTITDTTVSSEELPVIAQLPNITKLTMRRCSLSTLAGLESATTLTHLDLGNNTIGDITPLSKLTKLKELNLTYNGLTDVSVLSSLKAITVLDVSHNEITTLSPITGLERLQKLNAGTNLLAEINGFEKFKELTDLDLTVNQITDVSPLYSCTELKVLNISENAISDISGFSALVKLAELRFAKNKVSKLPEFPKDCELVHIDGSDNNIDTLVPLGGLQKLNNVFMDRNQGISSVSALADCPMLVQVNVSGTRVRKVTALTDINDKLIINYDPV